MTAFPRSRKKRGVPEVSTARVLMTMGHLCIPIVAYGIMHLDLGADFFGKYFHTLPTRDLNASRKKLYLGLNTFYGVRWSIGSFIMQGGISLGNAVALPILHMLHPTLCYIVGSGAVGNSDSLEIQDYVAATLMLLGGVFQHGSEFQRWLFKRDQNNKGQIHTSGLFGLARGINHTGHVLMDVGALVFAPNWPVLCISLFGWYELLFNIFPATVEHCRTKYGDAYAKYEKATPYLYIPGIV